MVIAVCDDQTAELEAVRELLDRWQRQRRTSVRVRSFRSASDLLDAAEEERFTLYLLDVMMPGTDGMVAAKEIRDRDDSAEIVFLTSSPGFAYESYGVRALDYLLKPIQEEKLFPTLDKLFLREQKPLEGLTLKCGSTLMRVLFSQLSHVEVSGKHLYFNLTDGSVYEVLGTLKEYGPRLLVRKEFVQIHRSFIVYMLQISELSPTSARTFSGKSLPISRLLYPRVQTEYMRLLFAQREE